MSDDAVLYMRIPAVASRAGEQFTSEIVRDLLVLLEVTDDELELLEQLLGESPLFFDQETATSLIDGVLKDPDRSQRLASVLDYHTRRRQIAKDDTPQQYFERLQEWLSGQSEVTVDANGKNRLEKCLPFVFRKYDGFSRQTKAERVSTATGQPLEEVELFCDLRPVFSQDRSTIEGMVPRTIMRVQAKGSDGFPRVLEAVLSPKQIADLKEKIEEAERKLAALVALAESTSVPIPSISITAKRGVRNARND